MKQLLGLCLLASVALAGHSAQEWESRTIYQVITDRFARNNGDTSVCYDLSNYCGGGFKGLEDNLDYIQNLGFDAIWISPVVKNTPGGYHGYWAQDLYAVNENFGGADEFKSLVSAMHSRGMWIMLDVVANHVGPIGTDLSGVGQINPFNKAEYYHSYCPINNWNDQSQVENCWLANLPDLNQDNQFVHDGLVNWIKYMISTYDLDGLRIDTCPEVPKKFWQDFNQAASVFTICEVFNGSVQYDAGYQGPIDATLNYPLFFFLRNVFGQGQSFQDQIPNYLNTEKNFFQNVSLLGNFVDNHDNARFLYTNGNKNRFKNAIAWSLTWPGIPILYYGDEQGYAGGNDPNNREILWTNLHNTDSDMYKFVQTIVNYRKEQQLWNNDVVERYRLDNFYCFSRGEAFMCFSNTDNDQSVNVTYHPFKVGDVLCNIFYATDCVTVTNQGVPVYLANGEVKLYRKK